MGQALSYQVLVSDDLTTWDNTGAQLETASPPVTQPDGVSEQVTVRLKLPASVPTNKYLKIRATALP